MDDALKKLVVVLALLVVGFLVYSDPTGSAHVAKSGMSNATHILGVTLDTLRDFIRGLGN